MHWQGSLSKNQSSKNNQTEIKHRWFQWKQLYMFYFQSIQERETKCFQSPVFPTFKSFWWMKYVQYPQKLDTLMAHL